MPDLALIIWRFQPFHKWHKLLIDAALWQCKSVLILIWSSETQNNENPYDFWTRKDIIEAEFSEEKMLIWALPDFQDDKEWIKYILSYIPKNVFSVNLYCWDTINDSAVRVLQRYKHMFHFDINIIEIPRSVIPISASQVREIIKKEEYEKLEEYLLPSTIKKIS